MRVDAEKNGAVWAKAGDSRVTRIGAIIRKLRIDELPQLINVLKDDMSFVGPRPERPEFVAQLAEKIPYYSERHWVKPGITGWAQLCYPYGASERDAMEKLQYDLYYVKSHSLIFDFMVLAQTAEVVLLGKGALRRFRRRVLRIAPPRRARRTELPRRPRVARGRRDLHQRIDEHQRHA